jgi:hypothetical protein
VHKVEMRASLLHTCSMDDSQRGNAETRNEMREASG